MKQAIIIFTFLVVNFSFGQSKKNDTITVVTTFFIETNGKLSYIKVKDIDCNYCTKKEKRKIKRDAINTLRKVDSISPRKRRQKYSLPIKLILDE